MTIWSVMTVVMTKRSAPTSVGIFLRVPPAGLKFVNNVTDFWSVLSGLVGPATATTAQQRWLILISLVLFHLPWVKPMPTTFLHKIVNVKHH